MIEQAFLRDTVHGETHRGCGPNRQPGVVVCGPASIHHVRPFPTSSSVPSSAPLQSTPKAHGEKGSTDHVKGDLQVIYYLIAARG